MAFGNSQPDSIPRRRPWPVRALLWSLNALGHLVLLPFWLFRVVALGRRGVLRILWWATPQSSVARDERFQRVLLSRFLSDSGAQALLYGALVAVVREQESSFYAALIGVAALIPPAVFSIPGGFLADRLPRRAALAAGYSAQAFLCFTIPFALGTGFVAIFILVLAVMSIAQISGPNESAIVPLVADQERMATANSLINLASFAGSGFGQAILAPFLVVLFGVEPVIVVSGGLLVAAAIRIVDRRPPAYVPEPGEEEPRAMSARGGILSLLVEPGVGSLMTLAALVATANVVVTTLAPRYVQEELGLDPAQAVYVFAPAMGGLIAALLVSPLAIKLFRERVWAIVGFTITSAALLGLGIVHQVHPLIDPFNPLRGLGIFKVELGEDLRTASFLAIPLGFGIGSATAAVGTYINRHVPEEMQGRAFALQTMLKSALAILPLLALGSAASLVGVRPVMIASPVILFLLAMAVQRRLYGGPRSFLGRRSAAAPA